MLWSRNEEGDALAEAVGEGLAMGLGRGVGDCVGAGLGVIVGGAQSGLFCQKHRARARKGVEKAFCLIGMRRKDDARGGLDHA